MATDYMAATETTMANSETSMAGKAATATSAEAAAVSAAKASSVTSAVLRPHGCSQEKRERRDGQQAAHTQSL